MTTMSSSATTEGVCYSWSLGSILRVVIEVVPKVVAIEVQRPSEARVHARIWTCGNRGIIDRPLDHVILSNGSTRAYLTLQPIHKPHFPSHLWLRMVQFAYWEVVVQSYVRRLDVAAFLEFALFFLLIFAGSEYKILVHVIKILKEQDEDRVEPVVSKTTK